MSLDTPWWRVRKVATQWFHASGLKIKFKNKNECRKECDVLSYVINMFFDDRKKIIHRMISVLFTLPPSWWNRLQAIRDEKFANKPSEMELDFTSKNES